jgi:hypothetical protein
MLPPREAMIDASHRKIMIDNSIDPLVKGIFYALIHNCDVGIGDILTIPSERVAAIDLWFNNPAKTAKAEALLKRAGVVVMQSENES